MTALREAPRTAPAAAPAALRPIPLERLWEAPSASEPIAALRGAGMPPVLERRYGGPLLVPLRSDRPTVVANFVSTLDGIVALGPEHSGGGPISGYHEPDRFVMALLRGLADVVVIGAGTLRGSTSQRWTADHVQPALAGAFAEWRVRMGLAPLPTTIVVTATGALPTAHPALNDPRVPFVVATTRDGARAARGLADHIVVRALTDDAAVTVDDVLGLGTDLGARLVLSEGGPRLLGEFVAADVVDELFLTLAPQLVGRGGPERSGLVEGLALLPPDTRWHEIASVRRSEHHLFLRYRRIDPRDPHSIEGGITR